MHDEQRQLRPSHDSDVVLDIGGDIGALVVLTDARRLGQELHLSPSERPEETTHVAVRERRGGGRSRYAAVHFSLHAGSYVLHDPDGGPPTPVTIVGGAVTEVDWS